MLPPAGALFFCALRRAGKGGQGMETFHFTLNHRGEFRSCASSCLALWRGEAGACWLPAVLSDVSPSGLGLVVDPGEQPAVGSEVLVLTVSPAQAHRYLVIRVRAHDGRLARVGCRAVG